LSSMRTLVTQFCLWDDNWNKLLDADRLPRQLREMQSMCRDELRRRKRKGIFDEEDRYAEQWHLPSAPFIAELHPIGINQEDSILCARRALNNTTGFRLSMKTIGSSPRVDIFKTDNKTGGATMNRYYIMSDIYQDSRANTNNKDLQAKGYKKYGEMKWLSYEMSCIQYVFPNPRRTMKCLHSNKKAAQNVYFRNVDGSKTKFEDGKPIVQLPRVSENRKKLGSPSGDECEDEVAEEGELNQLDTTLEEELKEYEEDEYDPAATLEEVEVMKRRKEKIQRYYEAKRAERDRIKSGGDDLPARDMYRHHVVWKRLDEAVNVCPMLAKVAKTPEFLEKLKSLVPEADNIMKNNRVGKTVKTSLLWKL